MNSETVSLIIGCVLAIVIILIAGILTGVVLWKKWQRKKDSPSQDRTTPASTPPPAPKGKWVYGWLWWPTTIATAIVLTWGFSTSWGKNRVVTNPATSTGMQTVQPKEEWVFRWITPSQQGPDLSVEVVENRNGVFRAVLHDTNGHGKDERVAGLTMHWEDNNLLGTWTDYADNEGGNAYLYKQGTNLWSGWWECNDGKTKVHIVLKRK